jgi:D-cysteine desulfhydrase
MTGSVLGGNKIRKLEFLLADALERGCDSVITSGSLQSNHCRATALAARQLGLQPHLLLRWKGDMPKDLGTVGSEGNLLLDRAAGARIILTPHVRSERDTGPTKHEYATVTKTLHEMVQEYAENLRSGGSNPYIIPVGGSNNVGSWGYIEAFRELLDEGALDSFDDIVVATGSGGTICGLAIANYLTGLKVKLHAVCVCDTADYFYGFVDRELEQYGLKPTRDGAPLSSRDLIAIVDGYKGLGYGENTEEELVNLIDIVTKTAVPLDPVYTLKGVRGLLGELKNNPSSFSGTRILYIHTGGVFGLYDGKVTPLLKQLPATNQVSLYSETT